MRAWKFSLISMTKFEIVLSWNTGDLLNQRISTRTVANQHSILLDGPWDIGAYTYLRKYYRLAPATVPAMRETPP